MLFQSIGSMLVGLECILRLTPDVYCDTMGAAFTYPVVHYLCNAKVVAYVHYPIISTVCCFWNVFIIEYSVDMIFAFVPLLVYLIQIQAT